MAIHLTADDITIINCNIYTNNHVYTKKKYANSHREKLFNRLIKMPTGFVSSGSLSDQIIVKLLSCL